MSVRVVVVVITSEKVSDTTRLSSVYDRLGVAPDCLKKTAPILDIVVERGIS